MKKSKQKKVTIDKTASSKSTDWKAILRELWLRRLKIFQGLFLHFCWFYLSFLQSAGSWREQWAFRRGIGFAAEDRRDKSPVNRSLYNHWLTSFFFHFICWNYPEKIWEINEFLFFQDKNFIIFFLLFFSEKNAAERFYADKTTNVQRITVVQYEPWRFSQYNITYRWRGIFLHRRSFTAQWRGLREPIVDE